MSGKSTRVRISRLNINQGGGPKKAGLAPLTNIPNSVARYIRLRGVTTLGTETKTDVEPVEPVESAGTLDKTFGTNGIVTTNIGSGNNDKINSLVIQEDGKIIAGGYAYDGTSNNFALARYNMDGTLDTTFGGKNVGDMSGIVTTDIGSGNNDAIRSLVIQEDGKIIAGGYAYVGGGNSNFALARYDMSGVLDTTFGGKLGDMSGVVTTNIGSYDGINSLFIQEDGKIIAGGYTYVDGSGYKFALARYDMSGVLDTTFGGKNVGDMSGVVTTDIGNGGNDGINSLVIYGGKIIAGGYANVGTSNYKFALARYDMSGVLDTTFGGKNVGDMSGIVTTNIGSGNDEITSLVIYDGKIIAGGYTYVDGSGNKFALARYDMSGVLDTTFGGKNVGDMSGVVTTDIGNGYDDLINSLVIQEDGKIIAGGYANVGTSNKFALARYDMSGVLDTTFGGKNVGDMSGVVTTNIGSGNDEISSLVIYDGKIIAGGYANDGSNYNFALARYLL